MKQKLIGDVVFLSDKDLGIESTNQNDRPCIILHIDDDGFYWVVHMTTKKGFDGDPNREQIKISNGSYVKINQKPNRISEIKIHYSDTPASDHAYKYSFTEQEFKTIHDKLKKYWE